MGQIKLVHTADVHIKDKDSEGFNALKEILEKSAEAKADILIIAGDLFEDDKSAYDVRSEVRELFESYPKLKVFLISGNHDSQSYEKNINYGSNVTLLSEKPFEKALIAEGITLYAVPFERNSNISSALETLSAEASRKDTFNIMASHGTLIDPWLSQVLIYLSNYEKSADSFYIYGEDIEKSALDLVLLGHYHKYTEKNFGKTFVTYSGSPVTTSIKNAGKRRASIITIDSGKKTFKMDPIVLSSPYNISLTFKVFPGKEDKTIKEMEEFAEKNKDKDALLELKIEGYIDSDEKEFGKTVDAFVKRSNGKYKELTVKNSARQISALKTVPVAQQFLQMLEEELPQNAKTETDREIYSKALELALDSFETVLLKKKK